MTTGDDGPLPPDAEHYLDLSDVQDEQAGPHFDVVLRGYDRRQVDDHVAGLQRMVSQLKAQLAVRRRRSETTSGAIPEARTPAELPPASDDGALGAMDTLDEMERRDPDTVGAFNDRLRGILAAAEQEAQMVRSRAAESLLAEHAESRAALADLRAQRDAVFDDLVRLRGWLDELVTSAGRPGSPPPAISAPGALPGPARPGPWRPRGPMPGPGVGGYGPRPRPQSRPQPRPHPAAPPPSEGVDPAGGRDQGGAADVDAPTASTDTGGTGIRRGLPAGLDASDTTDIVHPPDTAEVEETGEAGVVSGERSRG